MNMLDYLKWRGDLTFEQDEFNVVDNLILSYIAYTDLAGIADYDHAITLAEAAQGYFELHPEKEVLSCHTFFKMSGFVLKAAGASRRFGSCRISRYIDIVDQQTTEQFCAMHIQLDNKLTYIAFRGTDDTIIGWHEDFQMAYKVPQAQIKAVDYLNQTALSGRRYLVGGHSKGGNLAVYGSAMCNPAVQRRIQTIYSNDGPGLNDEQCASAAYKAIEDRIVKIMPKFDVIGLLFNGNPNTCFIESDEFAIMQHDAMSWQIEGKQFVPAECERVCANFALSVNDFLRSSDKQQVRQFVRDLFAAFEKADIHTISDIAEGGLFVFIRFITSLTVLDEDSRRFVKGVLDIIRETTGKEIDVFLDSINPINKVRKLAKEKLEPLLENPLPIKRGRRKKKAEEPADPQ